MKIEIPLDVKLTMVTNQLVRLHRDKKFAIEVNQISAIPDMDFIDTIDEAIKNKGEELNKILGEMKNVK